MAGGALRSRFALADFGSPWRRPLIAIAAVVAICPPAPGQRRDGTDGPGAGLCALLAGRYENSAQVARGRARRETPAPQHVTLSIEPTAKADWELWRVHMDVDPAVAQAAGSDTSLDAVWAMQIARRAGPRPLRLVPHSLKPSVPLGPVSAAAFDERQWYSLEACTLIGEAGPGRLVAQVPPDEMCVAASMGLGGKRAFLPTLVKREGDRMYAQLIYFGKPWLVAARRQAGDPPGGCRGR